MSRRTTTPTPSSPAGQVPRYGDRPFDSQRHDPYQADAKQAGPAICFDCGAIYSAGRWQWGEPAADAHRTLCPACRRVHDKLPAGTLVLDGPYVPAHRDALLHIVEAEAAHERQEHPLNRTMRIDAHGDRIEVPTTDIHLPQRIGKALERAHGGELTIHYDADAYGVRVHWHR
jgi:hypothetical protein